MNIRVRYHRRKNKGGHSRHMVPSFRNRGKDLFALTEVPIFATTCGPTLKYFLNLWRGNPVNIMTTSLKYNDHTILI